MTPQAYREALAALGLTQAGAAKFLGVSLRTSQAWATTESSDAKQRPRIPVAVAKLLALMIEHRRLRALRDQAARALRLLRKEPL